MLKKKYVLDLDSITDIGNLVNDINNEIESSVDGVVGRQVVDAKSFLGMVAIAGHEVTLAINSEDDRELRSFGAICHRYKIVGNAEEW